MSHEQMLAWLDQAHPGTVRFAADRLTAAAEEIRKIGEELKVRPQYVEWKGAGADAFRIWAGDLANSTLRLGDFSDDAAKWLGQASDAIAHAQASIPRDTKSAQANPNAATLAHNGSDATAVSTKSANELAALAAAKEKVRQEAALQMLKLGQSYRLSATQLDGLERPAFPPPPDAIRPPEKYGSSEDLARSEDPSSHRSGGRATVSDLVDADGVTHTRAAQPDQPEAKTIAVGQTSADRPVLDDRESSTQVGIDSVGSLPDSSHPATSTTGGVPAPVRPETGALPSVGAIAAPIAGVGSRGPVGFSGPGGSAVGGRTSGPLGQGTRGSVIGRGAGEASPVPNGDLRGSGAASGRSAPGPGLPAGRGVPAGSGISGGRPTGTPTTGRSTGRPSGSTVVGGERAGSRGPTGRVPVAEPGRQATAGPVAGRSFPTPSNGVVGGTPQRTGRTPARPGAPVPSAPTRGISGGTPIEAGPRVGVPGGAARSPGRTGQGKQEQRARRRSEPPLSD
ncbi:translation initiation factor IF-2 [Streptomyces sp. NBC_00989]|uniref:translation initiation factor IF-2 n=1 Tax=Streptomyces sp. NBC_00989 TaxID=2903705 RepID=UPI00386530D9|nr:translation initiation factor IF-2 [Streptomyces sp. NBC_00989]